MAQPPYKRAHFFVVYRPRRQMPVGAVRSSGGALPAVRTAHSRPALSRRKSGTTAGKIRDVPAVIGTKIHEIETHRKKVNDNSPGRKPAQANGIRCLGSEFWGSVRSRKGGNRTVGVSGVRRRSCPCRRNRRPGCCRRSVHRRRSRRGFRIRRAWNRRRSCRRRDGDRRDGNNSRAGGRRP